jgi:hypothetical protein
MNDSFLPFSIFCHSIIRICLEFRYSSFEFCLTASDFTFDVRLFAILSTDSGRLTSELLLKWPVERISQQHHFP